MSFQDALLFSVIISPYGSVAVKNLCKRFNVQEKLASILKGEAILSNGTAFGMF